MTETERKTWVVDESGAGDYRTLTEAVGSHLPGVDVQSAEKARRTVLRFPPCAAWTHHPKP